MKKLVCLGLSCVMSVMLASCGTTAGDASSEVPQSTTAQSSAPIGGDTSEAPQNDGAAAGEIGASVFADFTQNINVDRASDYAMNELVLPVESIGRQITTDVKPNQEYRIVVMTRNSTNPYMVGMWAGGDKAGADMGIKVQTLAPAQQDSIEEQVSIMESMIQQGVDGFVIHPSDSKGIQPVVDLANENGIPVVAIGTAPTTGAFMRSGVDYYATGYIVTRELCEAAGGKGGVIILEGPAGVQNMEERLAGIRDAIAEYPEIEIITSQTANCKRAEGMQVMENLLQREDTVEKLAMVATCNDEMAIGAIQALKAAGVEGVLVGGADGSKDACQAIADGDLYMTYNTDPFGSTYLGVTYIVQYLNDGTLPEEYFVPFPAERHNPLITKENVQEYVEKYKWFD